MSGFLHHCQWQLNVDTNNYGMLGISSVPQWQLSVDTNTWDARFLFCTAVATEYWHKCNGCQVSILHHSGTWMFTQVHASPGLYSARQWQLIVDTNIWNARFQYFTTVAIDSWQKKAFGMPDFFSVSHWQLSIDTNARNARYSTRSVMQWQPTPKYGIAHSSYATIITWHKTMNKAYEIKQYEIRKKFRKLKFG